MAHDEPARADPIARKTWRTVEPLHAMVYFAPEAAASYRSLGFRPEAGYFVSRSAPMGAVDAATVVATFFNFEPGLVHRCMDGAWSRVGPNALCAARQAVADQALRRMLGDEVDSQEMARAAALARVAAEAATPRTGGRALFAGHAALPWPDPPHLVLWHAQTLLREFRGDGHIAALVTHELDPVEALVLHAASGEAAEDVLRTTRGWPDEAWEAGVSRLVARGWLADDRVPGPGVPALTSEGAAARAGIEADTDRLAAGPYEALGEEGCAELRALARPFSRAVVAAAGFGPATRATGDRR